MPMGTNSFFFLSFSRWNVWQLRWKDLPSFCIVPNSLLNSLFAHGYNFADIKWSPCESSLYQPYINYSFVENVLNRVVGLLFSVFHQRWDLSLQHSILSFFVLTFAYPRSKRWKCDDDMVRKPHLTLRPAMPVPCLIIFHCDFSCNTL